MKEKKKTAVVLSGGGAKGAYEAGALLTIAQKLPEIHVMSGASIGAINAAVFAWEYEQTGDLIKASEKLRSTWKELDDLFEVNFLRIALQALCSYFRTRSPLNFSALVSNKKIKKKLDELIPKDLKISDFTRIELLINATSLTEGKSISFNRKNDANLHEAVLASSCLPLIFESQLIKGNFYVDGGVFNNTPLRDALEVGSTDVYVIELKPMSKDLYLETIQDPTDFRSIKNVGSRMIELITDKIMYEDLKNAKRINDIIEVIQTLEHSGANRRIIENLKKSIGYEKGSKLKRHVRFHEIAPTERLEPPGTLGFKDKEALERIIRLGEEDAENQLRDLTRGRRKRVS